MFICRIKKNNIVYTEGELIDDPKNKTKKQLTWDDIPKDIRITGLQLVYPFPVKFRTSKGKESAPFSPKLAIRDFNRYYFFNEATVPIMIKGQEIIREGITTLVAKTIAGIDDRTKLVIEFRMDKYGNCTVNKYPLSKLDALIKSGTFRKEIIRRGI